MYAQQVKRFTMMNKGLAVLGNKQLSALVCREVAGI
jgi:hypothetical protein